MTTLNLPPSQALGSISITDLRERLADPNLVFVDARPTAAYNGWPLNGEARGGHIPGAVAFPSAWLASVEDAEVQRLLHEKGVTHGRTIVVYGDGTDDAAALGERLTRLGHDDVWVDGAGFSAWAADDGLPLDRLPNYEKLVHPAWVAGLIAGEPSDTYPGTGFLVLHVNFGVPDEYDDGHLPGALYLDTNRLEDPVDWNRRSPDELHATLLAHGISADTTVVLYGRDTIGHANEKWPGRRAGQIAATRAALILGYAGIRDVRVLDGGYDHWVHAGNPVETVIREPIPVASFGVAIPQRRDFIVDIGEAKSILAADDAVLVSVRTWREHLGRTSGYNYIGPAGRIAGDVWGNCGSDAYHMQHYRSVDNTMRPYPEIAANWEAAGITPDKWVAFYCGTGWRAAETWFYAFLMGWQRIAVYDGGWFEWSADPGNPIEVGGEEDAAVA
ncbi:MAG: thiosulfate sulfurtransferase [Chloroflexi bacterium]|nr:thiosulfate sulfurtransferase [Chloroflexota bacterium]